MSGGAVVSTGPFKVTVRRPGPCTRCDGAGEIALSRGERDETGTLAGERRPDGYFATVIVCPDCVGMDGPVWPLAVAAVRAFAAVDEDLREFVAGQVADDATPREAMSLADAACRIPAEGGKVLARSGESIEVEATTWERLIDDLVNAGEVVPCVIGDPEVCREILERWNSRFGVVKHAGEGVGSDG